MTRNEKRETLAFARELLVTAEQLRGIPVIPDEIDDEVQECRKQLIQEAVFALGFIYEVADAEFQRKWSKDPRNPDADSTKPTGFVPDDDEDEDED